MSKQDDIQTRPTDANVVEFLHKLDDEQKREDSFRLIEIMREITKKDPVMWGPSIIGFSSYHYKYDSGREGDMPTVAFSPRKQSLTIYILNSFPKYEELLAKLGKHSTSKACLYIKRLSDVDENVLKQLITESFKHTNS